jgi:hypothetical protein
MTATAFRLIVVFGIKPKGFPARSSQTRMLSAINLIPLQHSTLLSLIRQLSLAPWHNRLEGQRQA